MAEELMGLPLRLRPGRAGPAVTYGRPLVRVPAGGGQPVRLTWTDAMCELFHKHGWTDGQILTLTEAEAELALRLHRELAERLAT